MSIKSKFLFLIFLVSVAVVALVAKSIHDMRHRSDLPFNEKAIAYHFPIVARENVNERLRLMEKELQGNHTAFALNMMAGEYIQFAKVTGQNVFFNKAQENLEESLKLQPHENFQAHIHNIHLMQMRHQFRESLIQLQKLAGSVPEAKLWPFYVTAYLALDESSSALFISQKEAQEAAGLSAQIHLALTYQSNGQDGKAVEALYQGLKLEDLGELESSVRARLQMAQIYLLHGQEEQASFCLNEAMKMDPSYPMTLQALASLKIMQKSFDEANDLLVKAFHERKEVAFLIDRVKLLDLMGRRQDSIQIRDLAEQNLREELQTHQYGHRILLAKVLLLKNSPLSNEEAQKLLEQEQRLTRDTQQVNIMLAQSAYQIGNIDKAEQHIKRALTFPRTNLEAKNLMLKILLAHGDRQAADKIKKELYQINPDYELYLQDSLNRPKQANSGNSAGRSHTDTSL